MDINNKKIGIIGFGRVGKIISRLLMEYNTIETIYIYSKHGNIGFIEELKHINQFHIQVKSFSDFTDIDNVDIIFVSSSVDYNRLVKNKDIVDIWKLELEYNIKIINDIFTQLKKIQNKTVFVYTNPVDVIAYYIFKLIDPSNSVYGFGVNLDTMRLHNLITNQGYVVGEHGNMMVPIGVSDNIDTLYQIRESIINSITFVTKHQGYTSISVEVATKLLLDAIFTNETCETFTLSHYDAQENIFIGKPFLIKKDQIVYSEMNLNPAEKVLFAESIHKIKNEIKQYNHEQHI
ncbi:MAG: hypothetical protein HXX16_05850 [Bacteroidales bacterium]|nr:hypothetical protein [Bacteroidales bacterium]